MNWRVFLLHLPKTNDNPEIPVKFRQEIRKFFHVSTKSKKTHICQSALCV